MGGDVRIENQFLFRRSLHAVQKATSVDCGQDIKERRFTNRRLFRSAIWRAPFLEVLRRAKPI